MVAVQLLTLFTLLPALALGTTHGSRRNHNQVARRSRVHLRYPTPQLPRAGRSARSSKRATGKGSCRARPTANSTSPEGEAAATLPDVIVALDDDNEAVSGEDVSDDTPASSADGEGSWDASVTSAGTPQPSEEAAWAGEAAPSQMEAAPTPADSPIPEPSVADNDEIDPPFASNVHITTDPSNGLLHLTDGKCGACPSSSSEPNGAQWWLDCGLDSDGWQPPMIGINDLVIAELTADGLFAPCAPLLDRFHKYAGEFNVPPILLACIALQESSCNPDVTGGIGEVGLMQLLGPNCDGAPGGNCYDVDFNIRRGAEYFAQVLGEHNGNALAAFGAYNGWWLGMTVNDVNAMKAAANLDYMTQMLNGWLQGKTGYEIGKYFNRKDS